MSVAQDNGPSEQEFAIDAVLNKGSRELNLTLINPTNAEKIKHSYDGSEPQFVYNTIPAYSTLQEELLALQFPRSPMREILKEKQQYLLKKIALLHTIGTPEFAKHSKRIHKLPTKKLVSQAWEILERKQRVKPEQIKQIDAYKELQDTFTRLGLPWKIQKIDMIASAHVVASKRILYLKKKELFNKHYIERLKVHEIGTHVVRAENGRLQPLAIFLHGFANYLPTEEGLAAYNEEKYDLMDNAVFRTYAGRVIGVHLAQTHTFSEVFDVFKDYFSEQRALTLSLRVKRGVGSGEELGGYTKDTAYLEGYTALKEYAKKGGDFMPLYYGKVGLQHIPLLKKIPWLVPPKYSPEHIMQ